MYDDKESKSSVLMLHTLSRPAIGSELRLVDLVVEQRVACTCFPAIESSSECRAEERDELR